MMLSVVAGHIANFPFGEVFYYYQVAGFFLLSGYFFHYDKYAETHNPLIYNRNKKRPNSIPVLAKNKNSL